ncbi:Selenocysteine lyase/Cysteine desulfurase (CsdA) [Fructobacillus evanidus]|uniref:cysteine desulfurase n=1 Tax=Fructobacillus evanidus TaxID=3064281 RepID=UPI002DA49ED2|nr:Selenocysteine lyase/Cysteine desulfurase (CsdA) [Fructobacillus sp. LMG 32999]CAK1238207.1 Selenocysteine lyase/Cysteine desulfurase (CsdA) [Fructobacillus sp. LMG 32999]CAK1240386.1 Selenocysteine lyase/Cysteine desulfurase (CsdA) [Fructobacillus sp. LMG 32999]CAK1241753.1 Selenocysteine lyase/Cysteine desulfurase (CsdA) [Fructobacillus sp. LMG 32999]
MKTVRDDFTILKRQVNGHPLTYLDGAATSQKPVQVLDRIRAYYDRENANVHRGVYTLSQEATISYEGARAKVAAMIGATAAKNIVFTRSTTESLNWLAQGYGPNQLEAGDEILLTQLEHHSNIVPWQVLAKATGAQLQYVSLTADGEIDLADFKNKLSKQTKIVSFAHVSNVLGSLAPVKEMTALAHEVGATVIVDGAQAVGHFPIDVSDLDVDFYAFSGHKMLGPTGIGVLYGKADFLEAMTPVQYGGEMIERVTLEESTFQEVPWRFEAGTPNIAGAIGLGAAVDYLNEVGLTAIADKEEELMAGALSALAEIPDLTVYGPKDAKNHHGVLSFNLAGVHPHDVATVLDMAGVEVRAGHHCAQPLMDYLGIQSAVRATFAFYNNQEDLDRFVLALRQAREYFV